ncbi:MAG: 30S ribosomal protein S6 [Candidatus Nealsonbacteria bacterium]|nr:30S ribosomal protein S6 [Candidatus Nealsonbacteria bacterium]
MQLYELTYLINPDLSKEERESLQDKIKSLVQEAEGKIIHSIPPSKKELAYKIEEKGEAFLATLIFKLEPVKVKDVEGPVREEENVIRYLLLKRKEEEEKKERRKRPAPKQTEKRAKVELKEIEKKLEEILGQ